MDKRKYSPDMLQLMKELGKPLPREIQTPEEEKPEWLRGIRGAGTPARAQWSPADKEGNPK